MKFQTILSSAFAKNFSIGAFFFLIVGGTAFATNDNPVSDRVKESFTREFAGAQFVTWSDVDNYSKASFLLGGHRAEAYFNRDGEFLACIRDLFFDQLPLSVMKSFDSRFANADILDVREVTNSEGTSYMVTLEHEQRKIRVKSDVEGNLSEIQKVRK